MCLQALELAGIKFPDLKSSGVTVRSQRMKLPSSVGLKKIKNIEQSLQELNIGKFCLLIFMWTFKKNVLNLLALLLFFYFHYLVSFGRHFFSCETVL